MCWALSTAVISRQDNDGDGGDGGDAAANGDATAVGDLGDDDNYSLIVWRRWGDFFSPLGQFKGTLSLLGLCLLALIY